MNFVPKEKSKASINKIITEYKEKNKKEIEELKEQCKNSKN
nr:hypothetical protein [uncultured Methanobrevibacter sp.]